MKKHINKLSAIQKVAAGIGGAVVVLTSATDFFAGNYLVNYAIGRGGDGGNRTVSVMLTQILKPKKVLTQRQS